MKKSALIGIALLIGTLSSCVTNSNNSYTQDESTYSSVLDVDPSIAEEPSIGDKSSLDASILDSLPPQPSTELPNSENSAPSFDNSTSNTPFLPSISSSTPSNSTTLSTSSNIIDEDGWLYDNKDNYYNFSVLNSGQGKDLKTKLFKVISNHEVVGYKSLAVVYEDSDLRDDGTVWDMYGDFTYSLSGNACGNYSGPGSCWNKEHSMPKSWFNDESPMYSDAFHLFPTDGYINGRRSNYPFGEVGNVTYSYTSKNSNRTGLTIVSKLGSSNFNGYTGTVFEPDDIYKGDFARAYFYMVTAYEDRVSSWKSSGTNLGGTSYPGLNDWSTEMLLKWSIDDPISEKEIQRNNAIYLHQHNRNPYIDNTKMACRVFGSYNSKTQSLCDNAFKDVEVTGVSLNQNNLKLKIGQTFQFNAKISPANATNKNLIWVSSNETVAKITNNGLLTALNEGKTTITVKTQDKEYEDTCEVTVLYTPPVKVTGVRFTETNVELVEKQTYQLIANIIPDDATNKKVTYSTENDSVASISSNGLITALSEGETDVSVITEDGNYKDVCHVVVTKNSKTSTIIDLGILKNTFIDGYQYTIGGTTKEVNGAVYISQGGFLYNQTSFGSISKIEITYGASGSEACEQNYSFANSTISTKITASTTITSSKRGQTTIVTPPEGNFEFFRIDVISKNLQFEQIPIRSVVIEKRRNHF